MSDFDPWDHLKISLNTDGTLSRKFILPNTKANPEPNPSDLVISKDVVICPEKKRWVRIFRPTNMPSKNVGGGGAKLPVVIFFHSGGWIHLSAANFMSHLRCSQIAKLSPALVVSVDYRLAPEHRLPAQYEDAVDAINWVINQVLDENGDGWIRDFGDVSRCFLYGGGNGGNIVFHAALRALDLDLNPLKITGLIMNQPMLGGIKRTESEIRLAAEIMMPLPVIDLLWDLTLPAGTDRDHRFCNPMVKGPHKKKIGMLAKCLVIGFGEDPIIDRQQELVQMLAAHGVRVVAEFDETGFPGIDVVDPERATAVLNMVKEFINN